MTTTGLRGYKPVRDHLWLAWDRLSLRWRLGNMLPVLRRVRDLEAEMDKLRVIVGGRK